MSNYSEDENNDILDLSFEEKEKRNKEFCEVEIEKIISKVNEIKKSKKNNKSKKRNK